jgi:hypothetical protein
MTTQQIIQNTKAMILENIKAELSDLDEDKEIYFQDIISNAIDCNTPTDKKTCMALIDLADESQFDKGMIDSNADLTAQIRSMAFLSIEQLIFNDEFIQELQSDLNNEQILPAKARKIIQKITEHQEANKLKVNYDDNATQIFLTVGWDIHPDDFKPYIEKNYLNESQLINLGDHDVKILTSNKSVNQNAIVLEQVKGKSKLRVYLMDKDKGLDIRNLFKYDSICEENGFNLDPQNYVEKSTEQYEADKKLHKFSYLTSFKDKQKFLKFIVKLSQKLTERSIEGK